MSDQNSVRSVEIKARLLLAGLFVLLASVSVYVMYARGVFETSNDLVLITDDAEGVRIGMDMTFAGFPIGRVKKLDLAEDGQARIELEVPRRQAQWLRESSVFTIERNLIGSVRIRAYTGVLEGPVLESGAQRQLIRGDAFGEVQRVILPLRETLENLALATERMKGPHGALHLLLGQENDVARLLAVIAQSQQLLENANRQLFGAGASGQPGLVEDIQKSVVEMRRLLTQARESLEALRPVLNDLQAMSQSGRDATEDLGALRNDLDRNMRKIESMIDTLSQRWPFSSAGSEVRLP
jgi:phospholipid/cholesterol/gamma-HCH transport system substrate-binding protein